MVQPLAASPPLESLPPPVVARAADAPWSLSRRIGFRLALSFSALWLVPFPLGTLPFTDWAARPFDLGWNALTVWTGERLLHRTVDVSPNGSGDTTAAWLQLALTVALALVATGVWSVADRRRLHYARLWRWLHTYLRFAVGTIMIGYGMAKLFHSQFPAPSPSKLEQPYGDASPMGLLWTFMGFSGPYNIFTGLAEAVPATLLFFRRTATLGALLLVAVMTNVVLLNFCYDVPVKIFSTELVLAALVIALPRLRALADVLVLGRAVAAAPIAPLFARRRLELAARIAGVLFAGWVLGRGAYTYQQSRASRATQQTAMTGLAGSWIVESEALDGHPVGADEPTRWRKVGIADYKGSVRLDYHQVDSFYDRLFFDHDRAKKTLALDPEPGHAKATWSYVQPDADHLTLTGAVDGRTRTLVLRRDNHKREFRLVTRGFHWINEAPYNR